MPGQAATPEAIWPRDVFERKKDSIEQVIEMVLVVPIFKKYKP
jgi:hypothetical protein